MFFQPAFFEIPGSVIEGDVGVPYVWTFIGEWNVCFKVSVLYMPHSLRFEPGSTLYIIYIYI